MHSFICLFAYDLLLFIYLFFSCCMLQNLSSTFIILIFQDVRNFIELGSPISQKHLSHPHQNETASNIEMKTFDVDSVESSDTYASCNTHPFNSFDDFTDDTTQTQNVYINPMEKMAQTSKTDTQKINKSLTNEDIANGIEITNRLINSILKENNKSNDAISTTSTASPLIKKTKLLKNLKTRFNDGSNTPTDDTDFVKPTKPKVSIRESFLPYRGMI